CVLVRATGLLGPTVLEAAGLAQTALLTAAMFALGAGVRLSVLRRDGARPFVLALLSTLWVSRLALTGVLVAGVAARARTVPRAGFAGGWTACSATIRPSPARVP